MKPEAWKLRCMICNKPVDGFYGRWGMTGTCSRACEAIQEQKKCSPTNNKGT